MLRSVRKVLAVVAVAVAVDVPQGWAGSECKGIRSVGTGGTEWMYGRTCWRLVVGVGLLRWGEAEVAAVAVEFAVAVVGTEVAAAVENIVVAAVGRLAIGRKTDAVVRDGAVAAAVDPGMSAAQVLDTVRVDVVVPGTLVVAAVVAGMAVNITAVGENEGPGQLRIHGGCRFAVP